MATLVEERREQPRYDGPALLLTKLSLGFFAVMLPAGAICWFLLGREGLGGILMAGSLVPGISLFIFGIWSTAAQHEKDSAKYFVGLAVAAQRSNDQMDVAQFRAILSSLGGTYRAGLDDGRQVPALQSPTDSQLHPLADLDANGQGEPLGSLPRRDVSEGWYGGRGVP